MSSELVPAGGAGRVRTAPITSAAVADNDVTRAQAGDVDAFARIYRSHAPRVFALSMRLTGDPTRARTLTQDAFVTAWNRLSTFRGDAALGSWLHRITVNLALMDARGRKRYDARVAGSDAIDLNAATPPVDVDQAIDLERAIAGLPPGARTVFVLHDIEGYRHEEIARLTGAAPGTLRSQLHRARKLLMEALSR
jgi:RNA polymerase sigma-70 factor (ECF subfamily)